MRPHALVVVLLLVAQVGRAQDVSASPPPPAASAAPPQAYGPAQYAPPAYAPPPPQAQYLPPPQAQYVPPPQVQYVPAAQPQYVAPVQYLPPAQSQQYAPAGWPAPPPGYMYVPIAPQLSPGDVARRDELYDRLHRTETRLDRLERERVGLGGPITFMVLGYGATLITSMVALSAFSAAEDIQHGHWLRNDLDYDITGNGRVNDADERAFRRVAYGFTAAAGLSLLVGVSSTFRLVSRIAERKRWRSEYDALREQRTRLRRQLDYGVGMMPQQMSLTISGRY